MKSFIILTCVVGAILATETCNPDPSCPRQPDPICNPNTEQLCDLGFQDPQTQTCHMGFVCQETLGPYRCPQSCQCPNGEMECFEPSPTPGCPDIHTCLPETTKNACGRDCPAYCPVTCGPNEMSCPSDDYDGCPTPENCMPKVNVGGSSGNELCPGYCPMNPSECPMESGEKMQCPGGYDVNGCPLRDTCEHVRNYNRNGEICPAFCPTRCLPSEVECPSTTDDLGCPEPATCMPKNPLCPDPGCPVKCKDNEMECIEHDPNGCQTSTCVPMNYEGPKGLCYNTCPIACTDGQFSCTDYDPNGCAVDMGCVNSPEECTQTHDSNGCYINEPAQCDPQTQVACPGLYDDRGCQGPEQCLPAGTVCPTDHFGPDGCLLNPDEGLTCGASEVQCPGPVDSMGCSHPGYCAPQDQGCCPEDPPLTCGESEYFCPGTHDSNGCRAMPDMCLPIQGECPQECPEMCNEKQISCGGDYDRYGCKTRQFCIDRTDSCQNHL